jgi:hypothetical protein
MPASVLVVSPMQASQVHVAVQVWVPPIPHGCVVVGAQTPSFMQAPNSDQTPLLHVRVWVPQFPQGCVADPLQVWPLQPPQVQLAVQVWVPPEPQAWVALGAQTPSFMQAPNSDQTPLLHVRDWFPQLPQGWVMGPVQL